MKIRYAVLLVFASFILGGIFSYASLKGEIEETKSVYSSLQNDVKRYFDLLEGQRAIDDLDATLEAVEYITALQKRGAPRRYIGEEYKSMISRRLERLESLQQHFDDSNAIQQSEFLSKKAKNVLAEIETGYFDE